jgi:hypothetical protein
MQEQGTQPDFTGQHVYVGLDVSTRSWKVAVYLGDVPNLVELWS